MLFNLNNFLRAVSNLLDVIEIDILGATSNHSKRIAYFSLKIAKKLNLSNEEIYDLVSLSMLHDNGATLKILHDKLRGNAKEKLDLLESMKEHCIIGEENIKNYPFLTNPRNIIKYHHEKYDGSGFFNLSGDSIPLMSQIISFSDILDLNFDLKNIHNNIWLQNRVMDFVHKKKGKYFSPLLANTFFDVIDSKAFWKGLSDELIDGTLIANTPNYNIEFTYKQIHNITKTFSKIIDAKSQFTQHHSSELSRKLDKMASFYNLDQEIKIKLLIAADLHDIGKLAISNTILDKPKGLSKEEFKEIQKHPEITKMCLKGIKGFEDIAEWTYNHHEKLDGSGYPRGLTENQLDFYSKLLACLDIYQALREDRPYRNAMSHTEAVKILEQMAEDNLIDNKIVSDIKIIFSKS